MKLELLVSQCSWKIHVHPGVFPAGLALEFSRPSLCLETHWACAVYTGPSTALTCSAQDQGDASDTSRQSRCSKREEARPVQVVLQGRLAQLSLAGCASHHLFLLPAPRLRGLPHPLTLIPPTPTPSPSLPNPCLPALPVSPMSVLPPPLP